VAALVFLWAVGVEKWLDNLPEALSYTMVGWALKFAIKWAWKNKEKLFQPFRRGRHIQRELTDNLRLSDTVQSSVKAVSRSSASAQPTVTHAKKKLPLWEAFIWSAGEELAWWYGRR
jgi:hypothetical protein